MASWWSVTLLLGLIVLKSSALGANSGGLCRLTLGNVELDQAMFSSRACSICLNPLLKEGPYTINITYWMVQDKNTGELHELDYKNAEGVVYKFLETKGGTYLNSWVGCCSAADDCCDSMIEINITKDHSDSCGMQWDGIHCLHETKRDQEIFLDCPDYFYQYAFEDKSACPRKAMKYCQKSGQWKYSVADCNPHEFQRRLPDYDPSEDNGTEICCRTQRGLELSLKAYQLDTCAKCYSYIPRELLAENLQWYDEGGFLYQKINNTKIIHWAIPDRNKSELIYSSFRHLDYLRRNWENCCNEAMKCCSNHISKPTVEPKDGYCPKTWDGWSCITEDIPPDTYAEVECSMHVYNYNPQTKLGCSASAKRYCRPNGTWFINFNRNPPTEFTEYSTCNRAKHQKMENSFNIAMCTISMLALLPALIILNVYSQLRVNRIRMHVHFFLALFLNCLLMSILKGTLFQEMVTDKKDTIISANNAGCKILLVLTNYFRMTTYTWMVCEGFYLHRQISAAFSEQRNFKPYLIFGWGFPVIPTVIYSVLRKVYDDTLCWFVPNEHDWAYNSCNLVFLFVNLLFLSHIIYILVTKLTSVQSNESNHLKKAVRATVMLMPLFGIHYFVIIYHPKTSSCENLHYYKYFSLVIEGLQGLWVAILFCYINSEVVSLLRRSWDRYWLGRRMGRSRGQTRDRGSVSTHFSSVVNDHSISNRKSISKPTNNNNQGVQEPTTEL